MKNIIQTLLCLLITTPLLLQATQASSELPDSYPDHFQRSGIINTIHSQQRSLTVNDSLYQLANITPVRTLRNGNISFSMLKPGMHIGFTHISGKNIITEIWLLPIDYRDNHE